MNHKKRAILFWTITLTDFYNYYIILIMKKFYIAILLLQNLQHHLNCGRTLLRKFKQQHFWVKNFNLHSQQNRTEKSSPVIKFTVLPFLHCYFESSNRKSCSKCSSSASTQADRQRLHSSMAWFTTQTGPTNNHIIIIYLYKNSTILYSCRLQE